MAELVLAEFAGGGVQQRAELLAREPARADARALNAAITLGLLRRRVRRTVGTGGRPGALNCGGHLPSASWSNFATCCRRFSESSAAAARPAPLRTTAAGTGSPAGGGLRRRPVGETAAASSTSVTGSNAERSCGGSGSAPPRVRKRCRRSPAIVIRAAGRFSSSRRSSSATGSPSFGLAGSSHGSVAIFS